MSGRPCEVLVGEPAAQLLWDVDFQQGWETLADACPWTTTFQRSAYARAWFAVYAPQHAPVLVVSRDDAGHLDGLLVLAHDRSDRDGRTDGAVAPVGRHQAEYQGWLATASAARAFPAAAFRALQTAFPRLRRIRFTYLPATLPDTWIAEMVPAGLMTDGQWHRRGLMQVGAGSAIEASLRKSSNKSRLSRLQRVGPVALQQLHTRDELEPLIDEIARQCDARHAAEHSVRPFTDDPLKRAFYLELMNTPGLAHATVLRAGDEVVAAHLSVQDPNGVPLGVIAHAEAHAAHSPGKLLLLLLGQLLGTQGYRRFDLTPGGDAYKERFASAFDEVQSVDIWLNRSAWRAARWRRAVRRGLRRCRDLARRVLTRT